MTTTLPAPPARTIAPRPLWKRHQLFQEPAYAPGLEPFEDDSDSDDEDD